MQYVNDDMDELFRRAAQDYPLNTGGADWEKVQKALEEPPAGAERPSGKDHRRHLLWLLLLLPLPWICTQYGDKGGKGISEAPAGSQERARPQLRRTPVQAKEENAPSAARNHVETSIASLPPQTTSASPMEHRGIFKAARETYSPVAEKEVPTGEIGLPMALKDRAPATVQPGTAEIPSTKMEEPIASLDQKKDPPVVAKDSADTTAVEPPVIKKEQSPRKPRLYAGVIGGVDITSVEMQKVKKVGHDIGVVAGYSITKKWSVEAGLLSSEKAYYSSGDHLYKAYLLPGTKLREAEGDCRMWEVPLVVRYQFHPEKTNRWFISAGSASYFMKKESYDYTYYYTATGQEVKRSRSYNADSRHLFAAAQLSGGYSRGLGRSMELRIEPYLKLPLRKVGYYDLPLTSFGVHAGITKKLF